MLLSEAFERYREDVIVFTNQSKRTEESHITCAKHLLVFVGDIDVCKLSFQQVRLWKLELEKRRSPDTVRFYIIRLRVVLGHLRKLGYNSLDPDLVPVPKRADHIPAFVESEDVTRLIDACVRLRSKAIISFLYASGCRVSELIQMNRDQIHDKTFSIMGKGNRARLCFIDDRTRLLLDLYLASRKDNHPALFISTQNEMRMTATNIQFIMKAACKNAGISTHVTPHTLRHSFATNLLKNNANLRYVQVMLGHSSIQTTQMYSHVVDPDLERVYSEFHTI